ncbi:MAG TPA: GNAT family N-acetyltransferase [Candidatus Didemnitutus sp.]|nr:GNAT family N-acetyltransferase [Candidatus Didemnitutus sp.]
MNSEILVRAYRAEDLPAVTRLFHDTVHQVNKADYTQEQIDAWAPSDPDFVRWKQKLGGEEVIVAEHDGQLVGFCSWDNTGTVDFLYVHHQHQRQGIAAVLYAAAERSLRAKALSKVQAHVSLTAQPFFERQGFAPIRSNVVRIGDVELPNTVMEKRLPANGHGSKLES